MRVLVAMSGGVDSTLAAALLVEAGQEVIGATLDLCDPPAGGAPDPGGAAAALGVPHLILGARRAFAEEVVSPFVAAYAEGLTPNPCAMCNPRVKFRALLALAEELGADRLATGHYARLGTGPDGRARLMRASDPGRDQSYFLYGLPRKALERLLFPLGGWTKEQVRTEARRRGLAAAERGDSQEACFIPDGDAGAFLETRLPEAARAAGPVVDRAGKRLGTHRGVGRYTVGQRRGLGVAAGEPRYVLAIDPSSRTLVVGPDEALLARELAVREVNWLVPAPAGAFRAEVRIRSRHAPAPAFLAPGGGGSWRVVFDEPQRAATPGQAAVLYDGETVLGGGWIAR